MRLGILLIFVINSLTGNSQSVIDSNHVYNAEVKQLRYILKGAIDYPNDTLGIDYKDQVTSLVSKLLAELRTDSLAYISKYPTNNMYWNVVGNQIGKTKNYVAFVLTVTEEIASDFYEMAVGGLSQFGGGYGPNSKWQANGLRFYFVFDVQNENIVYYHNPMSQVTVDNRSK